ncbi:MAG: 4'-phosphopantetheinyl transferase superfamily protein [Deltaproteobacteria bacterium]|nr:4'-phosphopantetheinyl transferase superfamily protein [Deltaproteobacteria bacterium]
MDTGGETVRRDVGNTPSAEDAIRVLPRRILGTAVVFGSVAFASAGWSSGPAGRRLALMLLRTMTRLGPFLTGFRGERGFTIGKNVLGMPYLQYVNGPPGPSLSFSHGDGRLYGAMCGGGCVGIDVAFPEEFSGQYPLWRAFGPEELARVLNLSSHDTATAAALIWSVKEAAVKATGTGFNLTDPLSVRVGPPRAVEWGILFEVWAEEPIKVRAAKEGRGWLSLAVARPPHISPPLTIHTITGTLSPSQQPHER